MKMDLRNLVKRGFDWDGILTDELQSIWTSHFEMIKEIGNLKFDRAVILADAVNLNTHEIDIADASNR